jgi:hypothetical protein
MSVVSLDPSASRVQPPEDLNKEEAKAFRDLVTVSPQHFTRADAPLIVRTCRPPAAERRRSCASVVSKT